MARALTLLMWLMVYVAACVVCAGSSYGTVFSYVCSFCLLGPPANLIHGTEVLLLFVLETLVFFFALVLSLKARCWEWKVLLSSIAVIVWLLSGFVAVGFTA